jgi:hypothetical protein
VSAGPVAQTALATGAAFPVFLPVSSLVVAETATAEAVAWEPEAGIYRLWLTGWGTMLFAETLRSVPKPDTPVTVIRTESVPGVLRRDDDDPPVLVAHI